MYVYMIINKINLKKYIGCTRDYKKRWKRHISDSKNMHKNYALHKAIQKYGVENFIFEVIEECTSIEVMKDREKEFIKDFNTFHGDGYNMTEGGDGVLSGAVSQETRDKLSKSLKGRIFTDEHKKNIVIGLKNSKYKRPSPSQETRDKLSKSLKGRIFTDEHKKNIGEANKGRKMSDYTKEQLRKSNIGKKLSEETKAKLSIASKKFTNTPEYKEAARQRMIGNQHAKGMTFKHTEESKRKMSEAKKGTKRTPESMKNARQANIVGVVKFTHTGRLLYIYESIAEAVRRNDISESALLTCLRKKSGLRLSKGFIWGRLSDFTEEQLERYRKESLIR